MGRMRPTTNNFVEDSDPACGRAYRTSGGKTVSLQQHDHLYAYRPLELEGMCVLDFCLLFEAAEIDGTIDEAPRDVPKEELSVSFPEWVPYR